MKYQKSVKLAPYTTFHIGGPAKYFCEVKNTEELAEAFKFAKEKKLKIFVLGGGSNLLVSDKGFPGLVIKISFAGIGLVKETADVVWLETAAGENWDDVVNLAVKNGWWGIENLSHIPGSAGAIAVQNVGAYGQEASQVIDTVKTLDTSTGKLKVLSKHDCSFGYRKSLFNSSPKKRYIILSIIFKLSKKSRPNLAYRDLKNIFKDRGPLLSEIRSAIIKIRDAKYPLPKAGKNGSAGSFFKNPVVSLAEYKKTKKLIEKNFGNEAGKILDKRKFKDGGKIKIPAAFLIELCIPKGLKIGGAKVNENQPLIILNSLGKATAKDVLFLAKKIKDEVYKKTGAVLKFEPELLGF